jgi:hypothetical protein
MKLQLTQIQRWRTLWRQHCWQRQQVSRTASESTARAVPSLLTEECPIGCKLHSAYAALHFSFCFNLGTAETVIANAFNGWKLQ